MQYLDSFMFTSILRIISPYAVLFMWVWAFVALGVYFKRSRNKGFLYLGATVIVWPRISELADDILLRGFKGNSRGYIFLTNSLQHLGLSLRNFFYITQFLEAIGSALLFLIAIYFLGRKPKLPEPSASPQARNLIQSESLVEV